MSNFNNFSNYSYRFILEKSNKKHICPACNKKSFVPFLDTHTGEYLPEEYGRCDHENKCSYFLNPYKNGYAKQIWELENNLTDLTKISLPKSIFNPISKKESETIFFDFETFKETLSNYDMNIFIQNLLFNIPFPFDKKEVVEVIEKYYLGTISGEFRHGAVAFPFIDINNKIRAVQVKEFDHENHTIGTSFLHSMFEYKFKQNKEPLPKWLDDYSKQDKKISCLFGEHLLAKYPHHNIGLVEAPKTAIYCELYLKERFPNFIWIAVYNKSSLSFDKIKALQGRFVYVFPDLSKDGSTFKEWQTKAKDFESRLKRTKFIFSDYLEQYATEKDKTKGIDIGDVLIKYDWRKFRKNQSTDAEKVTKVTKVSVEKNNFLEHEIINETEYSKVEVNDKDYLPIEKPKDWSEEIKELETYFNSMTPPTEPMKLDQCTTITDCSKFIESHLAVARANNGNKTFRPYLDRLINFKTIVKNNKIQ